MFLTDNCLFFVIPGERLDDLRKKHLESVSVYTALDNDIRKQLNVDLGNIYKEIVKMREEVDEYHKTHNVHYS